MVNWWVYKSNSSGDGYVAWRELFAKNKEMSWGNVDEFPALDKLSPGDGVICYQTNQNSVAGVARVIGIKPSRKGRLLYLHPVQAVEKKVRLAKKASAAVRRIEAFKSGPVQAIRPISAKEVDTLFRAFGLGSAPDLSSKLMSSDEAFEGVFLDGVVSLGTRTSRNAKLAKAAKKKYGTKCFCCGFSFEEAYGGDTGQLSIVHHLEEFRGARKKSRNTSVKDVRVVCANCHRVLHTQVPAIPVDDLKARVSAQKARRK